jgi:ABC-type uncharacterized transport system permease subunit
MLPPKIFLAAAGLLYALGFLVCFLSFARSRMHWFPRGEACVGAGFLLHLAACLLCPHMGMNLQHVLSLLAFAMVVLYFILRIVKRGQGLWLFAFPLVFVFSAFALLLPIQARPASSFSSPFFVLHILLALLGIGGIFFGILYSFLYLIQERSLKEKDWGSVSTLVPSLAKADSFAIHSLWGGFILYSLGVAMGIVWSYWIKGVATSFNLKEVGALVAWVIFALLLLIRARYGWRGRRAILLYAVGVASILAAIGGIRVL